MKIIGFLGGQFGDAIITLGAQSVIKKLYPDCHFTFALSRKYEGILPLFEGQPHIQAVHTWEGYDHHWPTANDLNFMNEQKFDFVFNPMQDHRDWEWYLHRHQVSECCHMYGLPMPETNEVTLLPTFKPILHFDRFVAISLFPNNGNGPKSLSLQRANIINKFLQDKGQLTVQLAGGADLEIPGVTECFRETYLDAVRALFSCKLLVTGDTGLCWVASALKIPVVGLFATEYYPYAENSLNWQPVNPKASYLEGRTVNDIPLDTIFSVIESKL